MGYQTAHPTAAASFVSKSLPGYLSRSGNAGRDGKRKTLEEQLGDLIAGLIKAAAVAKEQERVRAEKELQRQELERQRMEQERLRRIDAARWRHICEMATLSRQASIVRIFLDELEERAKKTVGEHELPAETRDWFSWARKRADAANPVFSAVAKLVDENSSINEWSYRDR